MSVLEVASKPRLMAGGHSQGSFILHGREIVECRNQVVGNLGFHCLLHGTPFREVQSYVTYGESTLVHRRVSSRNSTGYDVLGGGKPV